MSFKTKLFIARFRRKLQLTLLYSLTVITISLVIHSLFTEKTISLSQEAQEEIKEEVVLQEVETDSVEADPEKLTLKKVGEEMGLDWKVLYGIYIKETQGDCSRYGDLHLESHSVGCFQIYRKYHPETIISDACAKDLECSAKYVSKRLLKYAQIGGWDYSIMKHNGDPRLPQVQKYLQDVKSIIAIL